MAPTDVPYISSGKHLICELKNVKNEEIMNSLERIKDVFETLCDKYNFNVLGRMEHSFVPIGHSVIYLLSESHISFHSFPEKKYIAMDVYTCREYPDNTVYTEIYDYLVETFGADRETPIIVDRGA